MRRVKRVRSGSPSFCRGRDGPGYGWGEGRDQVLAARGPSARLPFLKGLASPDRQKWAHLVNHHRDPMDRVVRGIIVMVATGS